MNALSQRLARFTFFRWMVLLALMLGAASSALAAKTYSDNGDGTVTDPTTALVWMRCSMGQTWDGATCAGTANTYTWGQANALTGTVTFAGQSDWRLPHIRELTTIVDRSVYGPAIDPVAFPNMLSWYFASSTRTAGYTSYVWAIVFSDGRADYTGGDEGVAYQVRLVRAGKPLGLLDISRPSTDYVIQSDGTATHTPTRLTWQRCAIGQTWDGSTCTGIAGTYTWDQARLLTSNFAGKTDWRLPTEEELLSLVDYGRYYPATNPTLFPNAPSSYKFWSGSQYAYSYGLDNAWLVYFNVGSADSVSIKSDYKGVRLVRAGQSFGPLVLTVSKTGTGQVNSSVMPGIECGTLCNGGYNPGDVITLAATPTSGWSFSGWSGACTGTGSCVVTMNAAQSVTATFTIISTGTLITRYRLYSDNTHEHLYTTDLNEYNVLSAGKSWLAEGAIYKLYQGAGSLAGVDAVQYYRLYNPSSYQHHWTTDLNEYNVLGAGGWTKEGVDGYILPTSATGSIPLYRLYLNAFGGLHLWTTDANEKKVLSTSNGWVDEGVAGYVVPLP